MSCVALIGRSPKGKFRAVMPFGPMPTMLVSALQVPTRYPFLQRSYSGAITVSNNAMFATIAPTTPDAICQLARVLGGGLSIPWGRRSMCGSDEHKYLDNLSSLSGTLSCPLSFIQLNCFVLHSLSFKLPLNHRHAFCLYHLRPRGRCPCALCFGLPAHRRCLLRRQGRLQCLQRSCHHCIMRQLQSAKHRRRDVGYLP
jgi:hypothetical protein